RGVLRAPPRPPRRGGLGVLRHADGSRRGARKGLGALSAARGGALHRAVLEARPGLALGYRQPQGAGRNEASPGRPGLMASETRGDKVVSRWRSERMERDMTLVRWGSYGRPVLVFPTAGGDAEEIERFLMIDALRPLLDEGKIKVYSCDSAAGKALLAREGS